MLNLWGVIFLSTDTTNISNILYIGSLYHFKTRCYSLKQNAVTFQPEDLILLGQNSG